MLFLHRYAGLTAAFFTVLLSVTGILLNHTEELDLHSHNASSPWLLGLYGIKTPDIKTAYALNSAKKEWIIEFAGDIFLHDKALNCKPPLTGAIATDELMIISNKTQLCLFTPQGELIDYLSAGQSAGQSQEIKRLGKNTEGLLIVDISLGQYTLNRDYTELVPIKKHIQSTIDWKVSTTPPATLSSSLIKTHKGEGLPWERVILDLHSGRIVGLAGVYFMDFIALLMIFLAITGVLMWLKRRGGRGWRGGRGGKKAGKRGNRMK